MIIIQKWISVWYLYLAASGKKRMRMMNFQEVVDHQWSIIIAWSSLWNHLRMTWVWTAQTRDSMMRTMKVTGLIKNVIVHLHNQVWSNHRKLFLSKKFFNISALELISSIWTTRVSSTFSTKRRQNSENLLPLCKKLNKMQMFWNMRSCSASGSRSTRYA